MLTGAEFILKQISLLGVKNIFGIPGAHIDPLIITAVSSDIEIIINTHELSAGYMADGYSRAGNTIGVATSIGGPGSNNMVTAVNLARIEKVPLLVITGDVPVDLDNVPGFQNGNGFGTKDDAIFKVITKYSNRVTNINDLTHFLNKAITIAMTPPYGPSHLIVPYNIFKEKTSNKPKSIDFQKLKYWKHKGSDTNADKIKRLILSDKKLVFWIGNSLNRKEQSEHIISLAEKFHIPVATTYSAKGVIDEDHELAIGNFGYAGSSLAKNIFLSDEPDVIIGFDIEQNERNSLNWNPDLYKGKDLILINYPGSYTNNKYGSSINDNPFYILKSLYDSCKSIVYNYKKRKVWFRKLKTKADINTMVFPPSKNGILEPGRLIQILQNELPKKSILFVDSGNHRVFAGFHWRSPEAELYYSASIVAPLGWAIASSIGCKFTRTEPVVVFTGDGCMQMHGIELKTAKKYNKPVLVIINNNRAFGSIFNRFSKISDQAARMASITEIDWNMFAKSFGAEVFDITTEKSFRKHVRNFIANQKLTILNVCTPTAPFIHDKSLAKSAFA